MNFASLPKHRRTKMNTDTLGETIEICNSAIGNIQLEYRLYKSDKRISGRYSYSLSLTEKDGGANETVYAADVSRIKRRASDLFTLISEGQVTVCTFFEILDNLL